MGGFSLSRKEAIDFALKWLEPLQDGDRPHSYTHLAELFKRDRKTISEGLQTAFSQGWVRLVETQRELEDDPYLDRDEELEALLCRKFPTLKEAIVLDVDRRRKEQGKTESKERHGDFLHEQLGIVMARFIIETASFDLRERENFGFGSGRAVYYTVTNLPVFARKLHLIRVRNLNLISLCGNCQVKSEGGSSPILDANYNANLMTTVLDGPFSVKPVMAESIAPANPEALGERPPFVAWPPDHALVGVGVLRGGHRFVNLDEIQAFVRPILNELRELTDLTSTLQRPGYCPVGDICNHLFRVPVPADQKLSAEESKVYDRIDELVEIINPRLLTVDASELARRRTRLFLVAGGAEKALAIRHLLDTPQGLNVVVLCTDRTTAKLITGLDTD